MISTPQTGAGSLLATYSFMGPIFAVYRAIAAFVSGIVGGVLVGSLDRGEDAKSSDDSCGDAAISNCNVCNEPENPSCEHDHTLAAKMKAALRYGFIDFLSDIAGHILIGIVLTGVISYFLPDNFFSETIGTGFVSMLLMIVVGIPLYMCSTASIPVAYAMMLKGVTPGAALVFLMVGPATNMIIISVVGSVMGDGRSDCILQPSQERALCWACSWI
ncbi:MAG: permease [Methanosarcinales archaeon]|nr:permease [Methanosarcinales archaeon]